MWKPEVREHSGLVAVGISVRTSNDRESHPDTANITKLWQRYYQDTIATAIPNKKPASPPMGIYTDYESNSSGEFTLVVGHEVESEDGTLPEGLQRVVVPKGRYLVFVVNGDPPASVKSTWVEIGKFFENKTEFRRTFTADFEIYRADGAEIFVAIE
ncbi:MAG: GyrI-like domain-containing protein [Gemmataceae bacterium]